MRCFAILSRPADSLELLAEHWCLKKRCSLEHYTPGWDCMAGCPVDEERFALNHYCRRVENCGPSRK